MFGGVGLPSAKGTGTNGYVERALGYLPKDYKPGSYGEIIRQMKANPAPIKRKINDDIILHEEKHKIEVELYDLKEKFENEKKYTEDEINEKINNERKRLYHLLERREADFMDKNETHQKGKLKDAQMKIIRDALKIKKEYNLGEGFEFTLQADEKEKLKHKKEHKKRHHKSHREHKDALEEDKYRKKKYWKSKGYRNNYSHSRSRSRSKSKNYNKNIRDELNNDYRQNKKIKLVESAFKKSPSPKKIENDDNNNKIEEDNKINDIKELNDKEVNKENENYEHEEGSLGE